MYLLKNIVKLFILFSLIILIIPISKEIKINNITKEVIKNNNIDQEYLGYIYIPKFNYRNVIDNKENTLDENKILLPNFSKKIGASKVILAGHNNRYVFNKIQYLNNNDLFIVSDFDKEYKYKVIDKYIIKVDDFSSFIDNYLYLMTCTDNKEERYIVKLKRDY